MKRWNNIGLLRLFTGPKSQTPRTAMGKSILKNPLFVIQCLAKARPISCEVCCPRRAACRAVRCRGRGIMLDMEPSSSTMQLIVQNGRGLSLDIKVRPEHPGVSHDLS
jgi:hypothetical protein